MEKLSFTFSELITVGSLLVSVTTSYVLLKSDVKAVTNDIAGIHGVLKENADEIKADRIKIELLQAEVYRINALVNFVYGESARAGWVISKQNSDAILKEMSERPWLLTTK